MDDKEIIIVEQSNTLVISEKQSGVIRTVMHVAAGAVTEVQLAYYEANLRGKIKQLEAELILKYFYGVNVDDSTDEK